MDWQEILLVAITGGGLVKLFDFLLGLVQTFAQRRQAAADADNTQADTAAKLQAVSVSQGDEWRELYETIKTEFKTTIDAEHKRSAEREAALLDEVENLKARISALEADAEERQKQLQVLGGVHVENMTLKNENTTLKNQVKQLTKEVQELRAENEDLRAKLAALTTRMSALEKKGTAPLTGGQS